MSLLGLDITDDATLGEDSKDAGSTGEGGSVLRDVSLGTFDGLVGSPGFQYRYSFLTCARTFAM
jgi:hypothetical protein